MNTVGQYSIVYFIFVLNIKREVFLDLFEFFNRQDGRKIKVFIFFIKKNFDFYLLTFEG